MVELADMDTGELVMNVRMPPSGKVAEEFVVDRNYRQDSLGPQLSFRVVEYQVGLTIKSDGILCQIAVPHCDNRVVASEEAYFGEGFLGDFSYKDM